MKHVRSITELGLGGVTHLLDLATHMAEINSRPVPKVPALRGRTVVSLFLEDSTRTRLSFETAAKRLSADHEFQRVDFEREQRGELARHHRDDHRHGR